MNELRDPLVGDALRRLDVPDHAPDFWSRLDAGLAHGDGPASDDVDGDAPAEVIELRSARAARRPRAGRSTRLPAAAAAAAAVALALAVGIPAAQQAADGDAQVDMADRPSEPPVTAPTTPATSEPEAITPPQRVQDTPEQVATEWLALLRDGRHDDAYAMLDESSQSSLPLDSFRELASGLGEGAAAFVDLEPTAIPLLDDEGLAGTAVVFTGDVEREGMVETASYAVVVTGDPDDSSRRLGVAFTLDGPTVEAVQRTNPSETRTSPLEVDLSPTAGATWAIVDGGSPERIDTGEATVTVDVEAIAGAGTHTVVVISTEGGLYTARSFTVVVP